MQRLETLLQGHQKILKDCPGYCLPPAGSTAYFGEESSSAPLEPEWGSETAELNSPGGFLAEELAGATPKADRFPWQNQTMNFFSTQANCLNNQKTQLPRNSLCPQLISRTANKSTNTNAPVPAPRTKPK